MACKAFSTPGSAAVVSAAFQIVGGDLLVFATGIAIGSE